MNKLLLHHRDGIFISEDDMEIFRNAEIDRNIPRKNLQFHVSVKRRVCDLQIHIWKHIACLYRNRDEIIFTSHILKKYVTKSPSYHYFLIIYQAEVKIHVKDYFIDGYYGIIVLAIAWNGVRWCFYIMNNKKNDNNERREVSIVTQIVTEIAKLIETKGHKKKKQYQVVI